MRLPDLTHQDLIALERYIKELQDFVTCWQFIEWQIENNASTDKPDVSLVYAAYSQRENLIKRVCLLLDKEPQDV
jgi:hypothetical protein